MAPVNKEDAACDRKLCSHIGLSQLSSLHLIAHSFVSGSKSIDVSIRLRAPVNGHRSETDTLYKMKNNSRTVLCKSDIMEPLISQLKHPHKQWHIVLLPHNSP